MPPGTPPQKVLAAVRNLAREEFYGQHRYALALHTDEPHPHVHLVVKAISEQGVRLNIKKATLRHWRSQFASHLRVLGVAANATERAVRGEIRAARKDGIFRASLRGESSYEREHAEGVARELSNGGLRASPGKATLLETRASILLGWRRVAERLSTQGERHLATEIATYTARMVPPQTDQERLARSLLLIMRPLREQVRRR